MNKLEYKGYFGSIEYSEEDNCFFGKVLGMNKSCITYEGENASELIEDFRGAVDMYLEHCNTKKIQPERPYNGVLNIIIPIETHSKIAMYVENRGTSINSFVCESIERRLETVL